MGCLLRDTQLTRKSSCEKPMDEPNELNRLNYIFLEVMKTTKGQGYFPIEGLGKHSGQR